jgi:hypothetical protein
MAKLFCKYLCNCIELENAVGGTGTIPRSGSVLPDHLENKLNKTHHVADRIEKDEVQRNFFKQSTR